MRVIKFEGRKRASSARRAVYSAPDEVLNFSEFETRTRLRF
jgi:hypothetical protein